MTSNIAIEEFRKRLELNTKTGNPIINGLPFPTLNLVGGKNKKFYGSLKESDFRITSNALFFSIPYILKGTIKSKNVNQTEVSYEIIPIKFGYYWVRYVPLIMLIVLNIIFITQKESMAILLFSDILIIALYAITNLNMNNKKRQFEKTFRIVFEID